MINKTDKGKCESFVTVWCSPIFFFKGLMQIIARTKWLWNITECQKQQTTVGDKITRRQKALVTGQLTVLPRPPETQGGRVEVGGGESGCMDSDREP